MMKEESEPERVSFKEREKKEKKGREEGRKEEGEKADLEPTEGIESTLG